MNKKIDLSAGAVSYAPEKQEPIFVKFTDISKKSKEYITELVDEHGVVYLTVDGKAPLKITRASIG